MCCPQKPVQRGQESFCAFSLAPDAWPCRESCFCLWQQRIRKQGSLRFSGWTPLDCLFSVCLVVRLFSKASLYQGRPCMRCNPCACAPPSPFFGSPSGVHLRECVPGSSSSGERPLEFANWGRSKPVSRNSCKRSCLSSLVSGYKKSAVSSSFWENGACKNNALVMRYEGLVAWLVRMSGSSRSSRSSRSFPGDVLREVSRKVPPNAPVYFRSFARKS